MTTDHDDHWEPTSEAFDAKVRELAHRDGVESLLAIPGVWEHVSEALNNDAIRELEDERETGDDDE